MLMNPTDVYYSVLGTVPTAEDLTIQSKQGVTPDLKEHTAW